MLSSLFRQSLGNAHRAVKVAMARPVNPEKWVFLVGCYNSGTTLLATMIGKHPEIDALPDEGQYLTHELVKDYELGFPRMWWKAEEHFRWNEGYAGPDVNKIRKEWAIRLPRNSQIVLEKTPANIARMRWLQANFSPAYFIVIIRNGYAVAEGIRRKAQPPNQEGKWDIRDCAAQWRRCCEVLEEDLEFLNKIHILRYEDLVVDPAAEMEAIWSFLEVTSTDEQYRHDTMKIHEREDILRNLNPASLKRLSDSDIEVINSEAECALRRYKYYPE